MININISPFHLLGRFWSQPRRSCDTLCRVPFVHRGTVTLLLFTEFSNEIITNRTPVQFLGTVIFFIKPVVILIDIKQCSTFSKIGVDSRTLLFPRGAIAIWQFTWVLAVIRPVFRGQYSFFLKRHWFFSGVSVLHHLVFPIAHKRMPRVMHIAWGDMFFLTCVGGVWSNQSSHVG